MLMTEFSFQLVLVVFLFFQFSAQLLLQKHMNSGTVVMLIYFLQQWHCNTRMFRDIGVAMEYNWTILYLTIIGKIPKPSEIDKRRVHHNTQQYFATSFILSNKIHILYNMKSRMFCTCCRKEIPDDKTALMYENSSFDGLYCLNVFRKLKAAYGDWVPDLQYRLVFLINNHYYFVV